MNSQDLVVRQAVRRDLVLSLTRIVPLESARPRQDATIGCDQRRAVQEGRSGKKPVGGIYVEVGESGSRSASLARSWHLDHPLSNASPLPHLHRLDELHACTLVEQGRFPTRDGCDPQAIHSEGLIRQLACPDATRRVACSQPHQDRGVQQ